MMRRVFVLLLAAVLAGAAPMARPRPTAGPAIAIVINGVRLPLEPPPDVVPLDAPPPPPFVESSSPQATSTATTMRPTEISAERMHEA